MVPMRLTANIVAVNDNFVPVAGVGPSA